MAFDLSYIFPRLQMVGTSDHASVVSMNIFVALLCACIVLGHLLEENRWVNESFTALLIVSVLFPIENGYMCIRLSNNAFFPLLLDSY